MKRLIVISIVFLSTPALGQWEWKPYAAGPTSKINGLGYDSYRSEFLVGTDGSIHFSNDNGKNWVLSIDSTTSPYLTFVSGGVGMLYAVSLNSWPADILTSTNGGITWNSLTDAVT